jgi:hypothetical protein
MMYLMVDLHPELFAQSQGPAGPALDHGRFCDRVATLL